MKKIILIIIAIPVLGFAYYAISPLFNEIEVNDELPEELLVSTAVLEEKKQNSENGLQGEAVQVVTTDEPQTGVSPEDAEVQELPGTEASVAPETPDVAIDPPAPQPIISQVIDTVGHPASGRVRVVNTVEGQIIRYEDFETINGPRLHVYLAKDLDANEFIDLGPIKGTKGNINYSVPEGVDLNEYKYVMYWCVPFNVLFNYADVSG